MIGSLLRTLVVVVLVVGALAFFAGYRLANGTVTRPESGAVGTLGRDGDPVNRDRARAQGAEVGEKVAVATERASEALSDGALTAKIKSKMALDDLVRARSINVDSSDGNVTLTGRVHSENERQRALTLARETAGVKTVVDHLQLR